MTDSSILAGLEPGDGAVKIPLSTHIALPIPAALLDREGHPYTLKMRVKFPSFGRYYAILNMPGTNDSDDMVFLTDSGNLVIALKIMNKSYGQADGVVGAHVPVRRDKHQDSPERQSNLLAGLESGCFLRRLL